MIIHIYSLIYILLLYILIERIIDLCFSLDCALGTQRLDHPGSPVDRLIAASPAGVLTLIIEELSLLTTKRTSVEISIC